MKASEIYTRIMAGELLLVGEYRGGRAIRSDYVDKKKGLKIPRVIVVYTVECALGGSLGVAKISGNAPEGTTEPEQVTVSLEKGRRYAFSILAMSKERDLATGWIGKREPVLIEEEEESGGPVAAPRGAATGTALP
ncbi:MAG: hypothetical protein NTZ46_09960 [Verrucomicrobia bacterium]|nr:hypothetical protein [Verrucomicrobiota bacterium]